jgi:YfiH family protein
MDLKDMPTLKQFHNLSRYGSVRHFISSREGGVSKGPYSGLNLGLHTADLEKDVIKNRELLAEILGIHTGRFVYANQAHTGNVAVIGEQEAGKGFDSLTFSIPETDAMVTDVSGICLVVLVADCVPLLFYDPVKHIAAVAHAGWRGTLQFIASKTIEIMTQKFGSAPGNILCSIGPSIGPCCYEVGEEVINAVQSMPLNIEGYLLRSSKPGKAVFDLWTSNHLQLTQAGVKPDNIENMGVCTLCNSGEYFSSRAGKGITGRFAAGICLE